MLRETNTLQEYTIKVIINNLSMWQYESISFKNYSLSFKEIEQQKQKQLEYQAGSGSLRKKTNCYTNSVTSGKKMDIIIYI